jgi:ABC-type transport system involved in multi-copper enzyme maturation permease subunit
MSAIWVLALLTLREALRRKLVAAGAVVSVALIGLSAWGFWKLSHNHTMTSGEVQLAIPQAFVLFMFMFSFVVALSASAIASPAVSGEVDSGVLQTMVTRPIRRSDVILGKWAGLAALLGAYSLLVTGVMAAVVHAVSGFTVPNFLAAAGFLFAEGAVLLTLVLLLSTRLSALASGVIGVAPFSFAACSR